MTQASPIIGANQPGIVYRMADNDGKRALMSHHKGSNAPDYAEAGTIWLDDAQTPWAMKIYDGADWIAMADVDAIENTFTLTGGGSGSQVNHEESEVSAGATIDLGAMETNNVLVTGSATVTGFGSSADLTNPIYHVRFAGAMTLTHHAANLILPGAKNVTTAAGDYALFLYQGDGSWRCLSYQRASGVALRTPYDNGFSGMMAETVQEALDELSNGCWRLVATATATNMSSMDLIALFDAGYKDYRILIYDLVPSVNSTDLRLRISTDYGFTWEAGASNYKYARMAVTSANAAANAGSNGDTAMVMFANLGNASGKSGKFEIGLSEPTNYSRRKYFYGEGSYEMGNANSAVVTSHGVFMGSSDPITAVRIMPSSGTISGKFIVLGRVF